MQRLRTNYGFWECFLLGIITLGIYPLYLLHCFARDTNTACAGDGKKTSGLLAIIFLSIITLGIYAYVWQAVLVARREDYINRNNEPNNLSLIFFLLATLILAPITFGIAPLVANVKFIHQQNIVNMIHNRTLGTILESSANCFFSCFLGLWTPTMS